MTTSNAKKHLFFIEIVGHAMRGLALAAKNQGHHVTGLDENATPGAGADWVTAQGIEWTRTPDPMLLDNVDLVIISGATPRGYPMLEEARRRNIPVTSFAQYLGEVTQGRHVITVAGTHGKTTTTSLITWLMESGGHQPDYLIGIRPFNFDSSARLDGSKIFVVEGDEYRGSHLDTKSKVQYYHPDVVVLTSVEHDHPDAFPTLADVITRFKEIVSAIPAAGRLVAWAEAENVMEVAKEANCEVVTYGLEKGDYQPADIRFTPDGLEFEVVHKGQRLGRLAVGLYGHHNVLNALAAVAVALGEGLSMEQVTAGAASFRGAFRRFQILTPKNSAITVADDYAHHSTEVRVTLEAAKLHFAGRRIVAVFRPHTYSRIKALLPEYQEAFGAADVVYITDIEAAREAGANTDVRAQDIIKNLKVPAHFIADREKLADRIESDAKPGDVIVCMTVSGYQNLANELAENLGK